VRRGAGEGELQRTKDGSQRFGAGVQAAVENFLAARGTSCKVGDLGSFLVDVLMILEKNLSCRPWSTAGGKSIFPSPVTGHPLIDGPEAAVLRSMAACLTSMPGVLNETQGRPSSLRFLKRWRKILEDLRCYFYFFSVLEDWVLCSRGLPMGQH